MPVLRIEHPPVDIIHAVDRQSRLWDVGLTVYNRACIEEELHYGGILGCGLVAERGNATCAVVAGDVEGVFNGDGKAVKGAEWLAGTSKMGIEEVGTGDGGMEEGFGERGGQLVNYHCSLEEGRVSQVEDRQ